MASPDPGRRRLRTLGLLVLTAIVLLTLDFRGFAAVETVQRGVRNGLDPLRGVAEAVTDPLGNAWNGIFSYDELEAENRALRERIAALEGEAISEEAEEQTLDRLLEQVDLPYLGDLPTVTARVLRGPSGNFGSRVVEIDKGTSSGIAEHMAVVTSAGLVGTVVRADSESSQVLLVHDPGHEVGVRASSSAEPGLVSGTGDPDRLDLRFVDDSVTVSDGDPIVTVGPEGQSRYPADIPIGRVRLIEREDEDQPDLLTVEPAADVTHLDFVSVIVFLPSDAEERIDPFPGGDPATTPDGTEPGEVVPQDTTTQPTPTDDAAEPS